jgi:hypothetical protein
VNEQPMAGGWFDFGRVTVRGYIVLHFRFLHHTNLEQNLDYRNCYIRTSVSYN